MPDIHRVADDPGDLQVMYQTVLNQAATDADLCRWLDGATLRRLWPEFSEEDFADALREFASRERRFGRVPAQVAS